MAKILERVLARISKFEYFGTCQISDYLEIFAEWYQEDIWTFKSEAINTVFRVISTIIIPKYMEIGEIF